MGTYQRLDSGRAPTNFDAVSLALLRVLGEKLVCHVLKKKKISTVSVLAFLEGTHTHTHTHTQRHTDRQTRTP